MDLKDEDIHPHLRARMLQRGVTKEEIEETIARGTEAEDAKEGTLGKVLAFPYNAVWENTYYSQKEVTVYYRQTEAGILVLTVKARYGEAFGGSSR